MSDDEEQKEIENLSEVGQKDMDMGRAEGDGEETTAKARRRGAQIVITGGLLSIVLWMIVLATGVPIQYLGGSGTSFAYALAVSSPAAIVSVFCLSRLFARRNEDIFD